MDDEVRVSIRKEPDIVAARQRGKSFASEVGITGADLTLIATAISEIARNILQYAETGEILFRSFDDNFRGIEIIATDNGPGIDDISRALEDGFSTDSGLGLGLPGSRRLMDEFEIQSGPTSGTTISMRKWI